MNEIFNFFDTMFENLLDDGFFIYLIISILLFIFLILSIINKIYLS